MNHRTWVEIDLSTISNNIKTLKNYSNKSVIAVVKSNAYSHGIIPISKCAIKQGVSMLATATLEEALLIRENFKDIPILLFGPIIETHLTTISENNITISLYNTQQLKSLLKFSAPLKVHINIDTGMNRLGLKSNYELKQVIYSLKYNPNITLEGIYSHFSSLDKEYIIHQLNNLKNITKDINLSIFKYIHLENSEATLNYNITISNTVRLGIAMYGLQTTKHPNIKPTFSLYSQVINIKQLNKGEYIGYDKSYITTSNEYIATVSIGYADGFLRINKTRKVSINNKLYHIVGNICMDHIMIKVDSSIKLHDKVELFGKNISIYDVAKQINTITYEIISNISQRVPIIYNN